jgi:LPXTG-site transpeptidase (sortase) family protein
MHHPAVAANGGSAILPMKLPKKTSAIKPYTDSIKNGVKGSVKKIKDSKLGKKLGKAANKIKPTDKLRPSDIVRYAVVTFFVVMASYLAFDTWHTNQQIQSVFNGEPAAAVVTEGTATSNGPAFPDYQVPADQPRIIEIPKINLVARVKAVGLTAANKVDVPGDASFAGWYSDSAYLGQDGASFMTGHYNGTNAGGVFDNLHNVGEGDMISVEMGDGAKYDYQVVFVEDQPVGSVDMSRALQPHGDVEQGLNIMTCSGSFTSYGFSNRLTVYTKRV